MSELTSIITSAVAATQPAPATPAAAEAITADGGIVGTGEPTPDETTPEPGVDGAAAAAADPVADATGAVAPVAAEVPVTDPFAKEHGLKDKDTAGRENRIPYSRVKAIADNAVAKALAPVTQERDTYRSHNEEYVQRLEKVGQVEHIMFNEQKQMIEILRTIPGYAELFDSMGMGSTPAAGKAQSAPSDAPPPPDGVMPDGTPGYTAEGLQKLQDWNVERAVARAVAQTEERLGKRYAPLEQSFQKHQTGQALHQKVNSTLDEGSKWPMFKDCEAEILTVLSEDTAQAQKSGRFQHNLRSAYDVVVARRMAGLKTDRTKLETEVRAQVIAEMKRAPQSTSAGGSIGVAAADGAPRSMTDVIKAALGK